MYLSVFFSFTSTWKFSHFKILFLSSPVLISHTIPLILSPCFQYYEICLEVPSMHIFPNKLSIFCINWYDIENRQYLVNMKAILSCSYDRICNYFSFTGILVKLILQYCIGKAVFRIFQFYAKQLIWIHTGDLKYSDNQGHFIIVKN